MSSHFHCHSIRSLKSLSMVKTICFFFLPSYFLFYVFVCDFLSIWFWYRFQYPLVFLYMFDCYTLTVLHPFNLYIIHNLRVWVHCIVQYWIAWWSNYRVDGTTHIQSHFELEIGASMKTKSNDGKKDRILIESARYIGTECDPEWVCCEWTRRKMKSPESEREREIERLKWIHCQQWHRCFCWAAIEGCSRNKWKWTYLSKYVVTIVISIEFNYKLIWKIDFLALSFSFPYAPFINLFLSRPFFHSFFCWRSLCTCVFFILHRWMIQREKMWEIVDATAIQPMKRK